MTDEAMLRAAVQKMQSALAGTKDLKFLIQKFQPGGLEVIMGAKAEPGLGHSIMFGLGGIYVESMKDVVFDLTPVTDTEAQQMVGSIKGAALLKGVRGQAGVDPAALVDLIGRLSQLVTDLPEIQEMDLNPVMALLPASTQKAPGGDMPRPPLLCSGCSHRGLFYALNKMKAIVHGDIGCYTLSVLPPLQSIDTTLCMGASISMAHGTAKAIAQAGLEEKRPVFAVIGDSTFFHSGITSLMDVIYNKGNVNVIILDNRITGMTGGQQNPGTGLTLQMEETFAVDLLELVKAMGCKRSREIDPFDMEGTVAALKDEIAYEGPSVLITKRPCVQLFRQDPSQILTVDTEACIGCQLCLKLGCPSISQGDIIPDEKGKKERRYSFINAATCYGCTLCEQVCKSKAIVRASK